MNYLHFSRAVVCFICLFSTGLMAQNTFEQLPRHQINASFGLSKSQYFSPTNLPDLKTGGLAYTYNLSHRFWASAEWQTGYSRFDWADYETFKVLPLTGTTTERITEIPVLYRNSLYFGEWNGTVYPDAPVALLPPNGFYEFRNWAILAGYQRSSPRNALRFGIGVSAIQIQSRAIRFITGINTNQYLNETKVSDYYVNATLQYDYWLTPKIAIGMRLCSILGGLGKGVNHNSAMLSVGYAIPRFHKPKIQPRA
jgi:hypothetical protein